MQTEHKIIMEDSRNMGRVDDQSVNLIVTSPPYWNIKDYNHSEQIGNPQLYEEYLSDMKKVIQECFRVLHDGCRIAINIGDQYLRAAEHGRYRVQPIPADLISIGMNVGFDFLGNIIWRKVSNTNTTGGGSWMGSIYYPRDGHITYEHEYILLFKKLGTPPKVTKEQKENSKLTKSQRSSWFRGIWDISPARQIEHIAMFPVELPRRIIKMYSFYGETVLDPFLGSGTTSLAAALEGRNSIGYEINQDFVPIIKKKIDKVGSDLFGNLSIQFIHGNKNSSVENDSTLHSLPIS